MEEIWKDVLGFEGVYKVSNIGRVKRVEQTRITRNQFKQWVYNMPEYIFKPCNDSKGYPQVAFTVGDKRRTARVHRLVAESFLQAPSRELLEMCVKAGLSYVPVNHKDSNPGNNNITNLEWCSPSYNLEYSFSCGRREGIKGVENQNAILTESEVVEIYKMSHDKILSQEKIAEMFGVKQITISNIKTGRSWSWLTSHPEIPVRANRGASIPLSESHQKRETH